MDQIDNFLDVAASLRLRRARALFFYLSLPLGRQHRTDKVVDLFWRGGDASKANASFRQTIRQIRVSDLQNLGFTIITGQGSISATGQSDEPISQTICRSLRNEETFKLSSEYLRRLLDELDLLIGLTDSFDSWIHVTRATLIRDVLGELSALMKSQDNGQAFGAAELALSLEPHNEVAVRFLMTRFWHDGAAGRAVDLYTDLYKHLDEEYDQEPEIETVEILAAIKMSPDGKALKLQGKQQKIALRVLCDPSSPLDPSVESFLNVLSADLRNRLAAFREWSVEPKHDTSNVLTLSLDLIRDNVLFGLNIYLRSSNHADPIWSTSISDPQKDWVDKVRAFVFDLAETLRVILSDKRHSDLSTSMYDKWLRGLSLKANWRGDDEARAIALFEDILKEAPDFGPAHAELAGISNITHVLHPGTYQSEASKAKALSHALEAVRLDPLDTRAHRVLAWCYCHTSKFDLAEFHFDQSLALNPQNVHTIASAALGYAFADNRNCATEVIAALTRLSNSREKFHEIYLAALHYLMGDYQNAAECCINNSGLMTTVGGWHSAALAKNGQQSAAEARFVDFFDEIKVQWKGEANPTPEEVIHWFTSCFPLRNELVRLDLEQTLQTLVPAS